MKKMSKIMSILTIVFMLMVSFSNILMATADANPDNVTPTYGEVTEIRTIGGKIIGGIQVVGSVVSVGILVVLGIKYMLGSAEEKAEYKKTMVPYLIGAVLIFAATYIAGAVYDFANGLNGTASTASK